MTPLWYFYCPFYYFFIYIIDYFGLIRWWCGGVHSTYWGYMATSFIGRHTPEWLAYLLYVYLILAPHLMIILLIHRMFWDALVLEPRRKRDDKMKKK